MVSAHPDDKRGDADDLVGAVIGERYRVSALVGRGGMGSVYRATDESLGRDVALKILRSIPGDEAAVRREAAEVAVLASLNHRSLVTLFDASEFVVDGHPRTCLVMEYVDGPTLGERIHSGAVPGADVRVMIADLAEALSVVHAKGVVHRDIKPANILLGASQLPGQEFSARLADFGIAYLVDSTRLTEAGALIGTAAYLSPEQATGAEPTAAADIYSLGLVVLETLTRKREFDGTMIESVSARLSRDPVVPSWLGEEWAAILSSMTSRDASQRPTALQIVIAARDLPEPGSIDSQATVQHEVLAPTAVLAETTAVPTRVLPQATQPTERLEPAVQPSASSDPVKARRMPSTRARIVGAVIALAVVAAGIFGVVAAMNPAAPVHSDSAPVLPAVDGDLGTHLQQLFDEAGK